MKKLLPVLFVALFFLFSANSVLAATTCGGPIVPCGGMDGTTPQSACKFCHLFVLFNNLIQFLLLCIVPPIAVAGIVLAGVYFIFSGGNPGSIQKAKDIIRAVLIGLFIVFTAWLLVNLFFTYINVSTWTGLSSGWFTFTACP